MLRAARCAREALPEATPCPLTDVSAAELPKGGVGHPGVATNATRSVRTSPRTAVLALLIELTKGPASNVQAEEHVALGLLGGLPVASGVRYVAIIRVLA